jgi:hypothetical protein
MTTERAERSRDTTGTGTWLEQLDEVHEEEHRDPVTKGDSGHTHAELERN